LQSLLLAATTLLGFTLVHSWRNPGVVLLVALFWLFPGAALSWLPAGSAPALPQVCVFHGFILAL
jgi:hypothetical protein